MRDRHSLLAQTVYHDLMRLLRDDAVGDIRGAPTLVQRGAKAYWYDSYRIGTTVRTTYLGEDTADLRQRLEAHADLKRTRQERARQRARLIRLLRAEGFASVDASIGSLLAALERAGVFRLGGTLVGTQAFRFYEGELGIRFSADELATTQDIDIASFERLSLALEDTVAEPIQKTLASFRFAPVPALEPNKTWRWTQTEGDLLIEFLTPSFEDDEGLKPLAALGVHAQSLHFLNFLIAEPIRVAVPYRHGVMVQVPSPERFAIHKLIVADRRQGGPDALKARKDRAQASLLIDILADDRPGDVADAFEDAWGRGPRWRQRLAETLKRMPATAERLKTCGINFD
jgi:hypothetical protein